MSMTATGKTYKMSEYCEDLVCEILGINEVDDIPQDIFDHVTEYQHDNDVNDGGKLSRGQVEHCINTMGQDAKGEETPAQRNARKAKLQKELDKIGKEDAEAEAAKKSANQISPPAEKVKISTDEPEPETETKPAKKGKTKGK